MEAYTMGLLQGLMPAENSSPTLSNLIVPQAPDTEPRPLPIRGCFPTLNPHTPYQICPSYNECLTAPLWACRS
jgi:hypothetical protein